MSIRNSYIFFVLLITLCTSSAKAQWASLQGVVMDYSTSQTLEGANVTIQDINNPNRFKGNATDKNGFYQIGTIRPGTYELKVSFLGFITHIDTLTFSLGDTKTFSLDLKQDESELGVVVVEQPAGAVLREEGRQRVSPVDLSRVPTPVAGGDLVSYLQTLPGVVSLGSRGGQIFIRGGSPSENMVLVDGILIYKPFHIVGFFSPFPQDLIANADFYAGGFSSYYSGRISSVLDINMRNGNKFDYKASASISPFVADFIAEGPFGTETASWIISMRKSLIQTTSKAFIEPEQPLKFESNYAKVSFNTNDVQCSSLVMHTYDRGKLDFEKDETIRWGNILVGGQCQVLPEDSRILLETNVNFSQMWNNSRNEDQKDSFSRVSRFYMDINMTQYRDEIRFVYGAFLNTRYMNYDIRGRFQNLDTERYGLFTMGGHFEVSLPIGEKISFKPGIVFTLLPGIYDPSYEPRIRATYQPLGNKNQELSASYGIYRQPLVGISDMRDASSVFVIWMRAPFDGAMMESTHYLLSWQQAIGNFNWSVEGYYKDLKNISIPTWTTVARVSTELTLANGETYGADLRFEYSKGRFYGVVGYGYSITTYESAQDNFGFWFDEPVQSFNPPHDRRHQVNTTGSYQWGDYLIGARWQLGTGLPFTQPIGFDEVLFFDNGLPDVRETVGTRRVILDKPYKGRLPVYHRLDASIERDYELQNFGADLNVKIGVINSYDRANLFFYDVFTNRRSDQLPFVPYIAFKVQT